MKWLENKKFTVSGGFIIFAVTIMIYMGFDFGQLIPQSQAQAAEFETRVMKSQDKNTIARLLSEFRYYMKNRKEDERSGREEDMYTTQELLRVQGELKTHGRTIKIPEWKGK